jgi:hypothetical protein
MTDIAHIECGTLNNNNMLHRGRKGVANDNT